MTLVVNFESEDAVNAYLDTIFGQLKSGELPFADARNDLAELLKAALLGRPTIVDVMRQDDQADYWTE